MLWFVIENRWDGDQIEAVGDDTPRFQKIRKEYTNISWEICDSFIEETGLSVELAQDEDDMREQPKKGIGFQKGKEPAVVMVSDTQKEFLLEYPAGLNYRCKGASLLWSLIAYRWAKDILRVVLKSYIPQNYQNITEETYKPFEGDEWINIRTEEKEELNPVLSQ